MEEKWTTEGNTINIKKKEKIIRISMLISLVLTLSFFLSFFLSLSLYIYIYIYKYTPNGIISNVKLVVEKRNSLYEYTYELSTDAWKTLGKLLINDKTFIQIWRISL